MFRSHRSPVLNVSYVLFKHFAQKKLYKQNKTYFFELKMSKKTWSTRLDKEAEEKIRMLISQTGLKEAEILRRLILIGLKSVKEPADLLRIT